MKVTNYSRKVDSLGRLVIPSKLRDSLDIKINEPYDFYIHSQDGKLYLCLEIGPDEVEKAKAILQNQNREG